MTLKEVFRMELEMLEKRDKKINEFFSICKKHLTHARQKHPFFAERVLNNPERCDLLNEMSEMAQYYKRQITENPTLENVLLSEIYEFLAEAHNGNKAHALYEAADVVAVILRALLGDIENEQRP